MLPQFLTLLFTGLRVSQGHTEGDGPLLRPTLTAWPSAVVPEDANVTLTCRVPTGGLGKPYLRRGGFIVEEVPSPDWTEGLAEFNLTGLRLSDAGEYTCEYQTRERSRKTSPRSEALLLLVTGYFYKPSLQAHPRGEVTTGENVTLQCQWQRHMTEATHFVILKAGVSTPPTRVSISQERGTAFSLLKVTAGDSGNYSCVYHMTRAPFRASYPSESVSIRVTDSGQTEGEFPSFFEGRGFIIIAICTLLLVLLASFLIYKYTRLGAADKVTISSRSLKESKEMETNAAIPGQSRSPALDEGVQVSRAEEPCGVTYAELDTKALGEHPSTQMNPSLETCVYSALKT